MKRHLLLTLLLAFANGRARAQEPAKHGGASDPAPREASGGAEEIQKLEARVRELEAELALKSRGAGAVSTQDKLPDAGALMSHLDRLDGPAMHRDMERLILAGEPGFAVLHSFLHAADLDHPKILKLTHDSQMIFAMLRIAAQRPDEAARLSQFLIQATKPHPESFIRRELYNFVPVFLNHYPGKYPQLQKDLEDDILFQLEKGGEYSYKIFIAMRDLGFVPPAERFLPMLKNPSFKELHPPLVKYLGERHAEGMKILLQYVREAPDPQNPSVRDALLKIGAMDSDGGPEALVPFFESPSVVLQTLAARAYFNYTRPPEALPLAVKYLNSAEDVKQKRVFVSLLGRKNEKILERLRAAPDVISDPGIRELLEKKAAPQKAKDARGPGIPPPGISPVPEAKETSPAK